MSTLFNRLTPRHFASGWPFYWRINLPFWIELAYVYSVFIFVFLFDDARWMTWIYAHASFLQSTFMGGELFMALGLYLVGWPLLWWGKRAAGARFDSFVLKSQFAILGSLDRFNRSLVGILALVPLLIMSQWDEFVAGTPYHRMLIFLFIVIVVGVIMIFVSLYGWLSEQWGGWKHYE